MHDDLRWNKLFGAVLGTGLLILVLRQGAEMAFAPQEAKTPGYAITVQEAAAEGGAAEADTPVDWGTVLPTADVAAGATVSAKCQSCHNFASGGPNQIGPNLWGVLGRKPGSHPGFAYSSGMTENGAKHPVWTFDEVYNFLKGPQAYVPGTKMSFVGLKKREDRINLIAWLKQQGGTLPVPAPDPSRAATAAPAPGTTVPATEGAGANQPVAAEAGAPASAETASPGGVTPSTGAAAAPSATTSTAASGGNAGQTVAGSKALAGKKP